METLEQIPIPDKSQFNHNHQCVMCTHWDFLGRLFYSSELETGIFLCEKCVEDHPDTLDNVIPSIAEFTMNHECMGCEKRTKNGILSFCPNCETLEFVCTECHSDYFKHFKPNEFDDLLN